MLSTCAKHCQNAGGWSGGATIVAAATLQNHLSSNQQISIDTPSVAHCRYALEQAPLAFQALESRQVIGKLLLLLGDAPKAHSRM